MNDIPAGQPGHSGGQASLRLRPMRIVNGVIDGGYADDWEIICPACGDSTSLDYQSASPQVRRVRGPYDDHEEGMAALEHHLGLLTPRTRVYYGSTG